MTKIFYDNLDCVYVYVCVLVIKYVINPSLKTGRDNRIDILILKYPAGCFVSWSC